MNSKVVTPRHHPLSNRKDAFRSLAVFTQVAHMENATSRTKMQPEEAFDLLRRVFTSGANLARSASCGSTILGLSVPVILDGVDAACWKALAPELGASGSHAKPPLLGHPLQSQECANQPIPSLVDTATPARHCMTLSCSGPVRVRYSQLHRGVEEAVAARRATITSLKAELEGAVQRNNQLPLAIKQREDEMKSLKAEFMASSAQALGCEDKHARANVATAMAVAVDDKVRVLRRRRDLRVWACDELRGVINEHTTRATELKKMIAVVSAEVKNEEQAHKMKAKRVEVVLAATSNAPRVRLTGGPVAPQLSPEDVVARAHERKAELLSAIEKRKAHLRKCTEEVFEARRDAERLELKRVAVKEKIESLEHEIAHVQRSCTPRPNWSQLLEAALVTTAVDRVGKKTKLRIESSRKKLLGSAATRHDDGEDQEDGGGHQLRQLLTGSWSTIDKIRAMSDELTRIRTKYHAGDTILLEQARLDHLQSEIARTLQQLEAIKATASERECEQ